MKVHVGSKRLPMWWLCKCKTLGGYFREELEARSTCVRCQRTVTLPLSSN